ncbi:MAG TPA: LysM peptidoglycan-binding domain-containing protein [Polyangiaceae bacterium]|jgi:hypothetical protein|nr:LysM peptidoglycan-binding domain-containing protein [Polyangiaceae bacterium]
MRARASCLVWLSVLGAAPALAQAPGPTDPSAPPTTTTTTTTTQSTQQPTVITRGPAGSFVIAPAQKDPNQSLPSSSRPKSGDESDTFDMNVSKGGPTVVGNPGGQAILSDGGGGELRGGPIPPIHLVRHGDTLWDLSDHYYGNPWQWPKIWSNNPQVTNPHWIYPGDQLRMLPGDGSGGSAFDRLAGAKGANNTLGKGGVSLRGNRLAKDTIVLRDQGFIGDPKTDTWGQIAGAVEEQMMLAEGNHVFLLLEPDKVARPGEMLTVFRPVRPADKVEGARKPPGEIVQVLGTVKIDSMDPKSHFARGTLIESLDVIERGAKIGPVRRSFDVVPPLKAQKEIVAHVLTTFYPSVYVVQHQVVFLDRGSEDGVRPGNRLVVLRRGDTWRKSLDAKMSRDRMILDTNEQVDYDRTPLPGDDQKFPDEAIAELRVLTTERYSSLAFVAQTRRELVPGDVALTRVGF